MSPPLLTRLADIALGSRDAARLDQLPTRRNEYGYDPFGFHSDVLKVGALIVRFLYRYYFRCVTTGLSNVPDGRVMLVSNHAGQLPFDGVGIGGALLFDAERPRLVRAMVERFVPTIPFASFVFARLGQVVGTPDNCRRLLENDEVLLVFPEGARGISKPVTRAYELQPFGHGFMRLAIATNTPIVPVAVVGSEEQAPAFNVRPLAKLLGAPAFPVTPIPPFFPIVPLPTRYHLIFGTPRRFEGDPDADDAEIAEKVRQVRLAIEGQLREGRKRRRGIFR